MGRTVKREGTRRPRIWDPGSRSAGQGDEVGPQLRQRVEDEATAFGQRLEPVAIGDLLVTSDRPGMAMKSDPLDLGGVKIHRPGTLIGKALEPLPTGQGEILVLLSLQ